MKKLFVLLAVTLLLFSAAALAGCTGSDRIGDDDPELAPYVSYKENAYLAATADLYNVEVVFYQSEDPKAMDGKVSAPLRNFVRVSYVPLKLGGIDEAVEFQYFEMSGKLEKSPLRYELSSSFEKDYDLKTATAPTEITLIVAGQEEKLALVDVGAEKLSADGAIALATRELKETLQPEIEAGFQREIVVKIVPDELGDSAFYFYVSFYESPQKLSAVLIDPVKNKVVAKKT